LAASTGGGIAVATERPKDCLMGHGMASAPAGLDGNASHACIDELLSENRRLREIIIYLSGIIIRDVVGRT
jgi:hypothetical protein